MAACGWTKLQLYLTVWSCFDSFAFLLIYLISGGGSTDEQFFSKQIHDYSFSTSFFDTLWLVVVRDVILVAYYGLRGGRRGGIIGVVVFVTTVYAVTKCVLFNFPHWSDAGLPAIAPALVFIFFAVAWLQVAVWLSHGDCSPLRREAVVYDERSPLLTNVQGATRPISVMNSGTRYDRANGSLREPPMLASSAVSVGGRSVLSDSGRGTAEGFYSPVGSPGERSPLYGTPPEDDVLGQAASPTPSLRPGSEALPRGLETQIETAFADLAANAAGGREAGWEFVEEKSEVQIYRRSQGDNVTVSKGVGIIHVTSRRLYEFLRDWSQRTEWDEMFKEERLLEQFSPSFSARWLAFHGIGLVSARDMCCVGAEREIRDGEYLMMSFSVTRPDCPEVAKHVRAHLYPSGFVLKPLDGDPGATLVTYVTATDVKGWIPASVKKMVATKSPLCIAAIRNIVER